MDCDQRQRQIRGQFVHPEHDVDGAHQSRVVKVLETYRAFFNVVCWVTDFVAPDDLVRAQILAEDLVPEERKRVHETEVL